MNTLTKILIIVGAILVFSLYIYGVISADKQMLMNCKSLGYDGVEDGLGRVYNCFSVDENGFVNRSPEMWFMRS